MRNIGTFYPIGTVQGETLILPLDIEVDGTRIVFDDYTFSGAARLGSAPVAVLTFSFAEVDDIVHINTGDSSAVLPEAYAYEVRMTHTASGKVTTLLYGSFEVIHTKA